jgi:transketolase
LLIGSKHELDNLVVLVDYNKVQALTAVDDALPLGNLAAKFEAFSWECEDIMDGHAFDQLVPALKKPSSLLKPRALIVHTIKGRGIRAFENDPAWHARKIKGEDLEIGRKELGLT